MIDFNISEKKTINFVTDLLEYYSSIDNGSINKILTSNDLESQRNNVVWYQHIIVVYYRKDK